VVQSVHMFEHVLQLIQVTVWHVPDDEALGLLGYVFQLQGTEEWLHLFFNLALLTSLWILLGPIRASSPSIVPRWAYLVYVIGAVGLETWHEVEHLVIISRVLMNHGCPCPGIGDAALGVTDTVLHFIYNAVVTSAMLVPFWFVVRSRNRRDSKAAELAEVRRSPSRSIPTSTARSVRSSSQSISSSAKARLSGYLQNSPIRSARSKSGSMRTWSSFASRRREGIETSPERRLHLVEGHDADPSL
jgi:hypothetical protein